MPIFISLPRNSTVRSELAGMLATAAGIWFRDLETRAFNIRPVAEFILGRDLLDRFELPDYGSEPATDTHFLHR